MRFKTAPIDRHRDIEVLFSGYHVFADGVYARLCRWPA
jgi:hypothetical protein